MNHRTLARSARLAVLAAALAVPASPAAAGEAAPAPHIATVNPALRNAPGYVPLVDPESTSVVLGRRPNAPLVSMRFSDGARSMDELGRQICWAVHHTSPDSLRRLCITRPEFSEIMWREFPQSRPVTGLTADDAWVLLAGRLHGGVSKLLDERGGQHLQFVRWDRTDTVAVYKNFRLHNGLRLVVKDEQGREVSLDAVRAVAERKGMYKIQSLKD